MSANNWATCPRCKSQAEQQRAAARQTAQEAYGKVDADVYEQLRADAERTVLIDSHLREDYELGIYEDGRFSVSYGANCDVCGFTHRFDHREQLELKVAR